MPFNNPGPIKGKGLKITNEGSSVPAPKPDSSAEFDKQAKQEAASYEDYKKRTWELSTRLKGMVEDKTLPENKSPLTRDLEIETLNRLVVLASEMNEDSTQPEGIGSTALSFLLIKMLLVQRDIINNLSFKVDKLEKIIIRIVKEPELK